MKLCHSQNEAKRGCSRQTIASWRLSITNHRCCSELPASISRSSWDDCHCLRCRALSRGSATHAVRALDCRRFSGDGNCVTRNCHGWEPQPGSPVRASRCFWANAVFVGLLACPNVRRSLCDMAATEDPVPTQGAYASAVRHYRNFNCERDRMMCLCPSIGQFSG